MQVKTAKNTFTVTSDSLWNNKHATCDKVYKFYHKGEQAFKCKILVLNFSSDSLIGRLTSTNLK